MKRWCAACWSGRVAVRYAHVASGAALRPHLEYPVFRVGEPCECAQIAVRWQQRTCGCSSALPTELAPQTALAAIDSPGAEAMTSKHAQCERAGAAFRDPMAARVRAGEANPLRPACATECGCHLWMARAHEAMAFRGAPCERVGCGAFGLKPERAVRSSASLSADCCATAVTQVPGVQMRGRPQWPGRPRRHLRPPTRTDVMALSRSPGNVPRRAPQQSGLLGRGLSALRAAARLR